MKILVLAAFIAAVTSGNVDQASNKAHQPWQVGKLYRYEVESSTVARLQGGAAGSAFKAHFTVRVPAPGHLLAKLEDPKHATVNQDLPRNRHLPEDLKFEPVQKLDQPFEIYVEGGRVSALRMPASLPLAQENLLKGLISALQVDLSTNRLVRSAHNGFDEQSHQGMFKKMETDVTGDCETLYNVNPAAPKWRFAIPQFANHEEPIMVSKVKNYGHCHHRVEYHFGVPDGSEWASAPHRKHEEQLVRRTATTRMLVGKQQGPIYKTEVISTVHINPHLYGKQKAEVQSKVKLTLVAYEQDTQGEWSVSAEKRNVHNLLYSVSEKQVQINDRSSESNSAESSENFAQNGKLGAEYKPNRIRRYIQGAQEEIQQQRRSSQHNHRDANRSGSSSRSASSASVDSTSAFINDDLPNPSQPAYAALYLSGEQPDQAQQAEKPGHVQKLVQDMAQQLQNPNNMPKGDFLAKFNIVVRLLASMNSEQLAVTSRAMENTQASKNLVKIDMWMIYRDAMTQVGNMPAFQQIKSWIENKKIEGEEAAEVVSSLAGTIRYPSKEIMSEFFNLALNENVRQQKYLNNTALIAATRLINMAQVNNETAHSYYPTHMYGRLARKHDSFVTKEVLPRLSQELKQAIEQGDSTKAQVYIKAIGNLGHPEILQVFAPYLEGKAQVSEYLREQVIQNLGVLAFERNHEVRNVLYAILRNLAEPYEARVAAIQNIFMADPSSAMLAGMAQMTHNDPSIQVRAVLKSGILSAAHLKNKRYSDLARRAQSVEWMVTKQDFGPQYSNKYLYDYQEWQQDYNILTAFSHTGSENSFFPSSFRYAIKSKSQGWNKENSISGSASDVEELYRLIEQNLYKALRQNPQAPAADHKYSAEKVEQLLNIKRDPKNPLEASITINIFGHERFFTLSESDLQQLPDLISKYTSAQETEQHYTKVINQAQVSIMFPVASGMPFIYKYKEPMVIHAHNKIATKEPLKNDKKQNVNIDAELHLTFARNLDGSVGFMDTLVNHYAQVGITSKIQIQVPLKVQLENKQDHFEVAVEYLHPEQDKTLAHYSVWPYSSLQKKDALVTVSLDQNTKVIQREQKTISVDSKFGQSFGQLYQVQGYSYSSDYSNYGSLFSSRHLLSNVANFYYQRDVALTHVNFKYIGKQSQAKRAVLTFAYDYYYNQKEEASNDQSLTASNMQDTEPNSNKRRSEIAQRVISGISNAKVHVLDISASINGPINQQYVATAAMASSPVSPKNQYAMFLSKNSAQHGSEQINFAATVFKPQPSPFEFEEALNKDLKLNFNVDVKYGKNGNGNVHIQGSAERTKERTEELKKHPQVQQCQNQKEFDSYYGYENDCYQILLKAHTPDYIKASVTYKDVTPAFRNMTYKALRIVDHLGYWYADVNPLKVTADGKIELESHINYSEETIDVALATRMGVLHLNQVPFPEAVKPALTLYAPLSPLALVMNYNTNDQYEPLCYVGSDRIWTFGNRKYEYALTNTWHVIMQDNARKQPSNDDLAILARMTGEKQMRLYISYRSNKGQHIEVEMQPGQDSNSQPNVNVKTNAKEQKQGVFAMYFDEANQEPLFEYYKLTQNSIMFNIREDRLRAIYDGQRLLLIADENRNNTNGLCGSMTGDLRDDFLTPTGATRNPEYYGASFALQESDSDPKTIQLKEQAKQATFQPEYEYTDVLPTNDEWRAANEQAKHNSRYNDMYRTRSYLPKQNECQLQEQVQYVQNHGEICISTSPLPACQSQCRGEGYQVRAVQVVCGPSSDKQFQEYRNQIHQGQNPQPSGPPSQQPKQFRVPTSCRA